MRRSIAILLPCAAGAATPVTDAADTVLATFRAGTDLALAARDYPDPWLVADELCAREPRSRCQRFRQPRVRPRPPLLLRPARGNDPSEGDRNA